MIPIEGFNYEKENKVCGKRMLLLEYTYRETREKVETSF